MSTTLEGLWGELFPARVRARGRRLFRGGAVRIVESEPGCVEARVRGSSVYSVEIAWDVGEVGAEPRTSCTCPAYGKFGPCKHLWALILEIGRLGFGHGDEAGWDGAPWVEDDGPPAADPQRSGWRARVEDLLRGGTGGWRNPWRGIAPAGFQIRYAVDAAATLQGRGLVITTRAHRRRKDGGFGAGKDYAPDAPNAEAPVDPLDRRIFAILNGASRDFYAPQYVSRRTSSRYTLGPGTCAELLPLLGASGRLFLLGETEAGTDPFVWDDGEAWRLRLVLGRDGGRGESVLDAVLERGDERMELAEPALLLAAGFVFARRRVARFDPRGAMSLVIDLRRRGTLRVPEKDEIELLSELIRLPGPAPLDLAGLDTLAPETPRPHLFVEPDEGRTHGGRRLLCRIRLDYGGVKVDPQDPVETFVRESDHRLVRRDLEAEAAGLARFLACGGRHVDDDGPWHGSVTAARLPELVRALLAEGWLVEAEGKVWRQPGPLSLSVRSGLDWFDLEGGLAFGDEVVSLPALLAAARDGRRTVRLGDGSVGVLPERWLEGWGLLGIAGEAEGDRLRFERHQGWLLDALLAEREGVEVDEGFARLRRKLAGFSGISARREPRGFHGTLRGYQREGLGWFEFLRELGLGGCLADDMGLGKTVQVLALLEARRLARRRKAADGVPSLVVVPRSLVFNWVDEAARFTPRLSVLEYTGLRRKERLADFDAVDLVLTTYGTLRRDVLELKDRRFDYVVLDEATAIKNPSSQAAKAARLLQAEHRLALSGTPIENHLGELWSLFEFLNPGMLGRSRAFQGLVSGTGRNGQDGADLEGLARAVRPFFLRRTKEEVLADLPEKTEQTIHCELGRRERRDYDELRGHYRAALLGREEEVGLSRMKIQVLEALLRLRQASCHPGLIDPGRAGEDSAKLETLLPMLEELVEEGHKALIFSQFTRFLALVRSRLDARSIPYAYLDGRTRKRREKVERFQSDPTCPLFLISLKAGGHGLNLTAADYVFLLDPWWNPAVESQAIDRAHRIGRTRAVFAYRLIARDTVEEKVLELQTSKRDLARAILGEGKGVLRDLTREDLERLLS